MTSETLTRVRLGMTDLEVSPIAFGTWELGGEWGAFDEEQGNRGDPQRPRARREPVRHRSGLRLRRLRATAGKGPPRRSRHRRGRGRDRHQGRPADERRGSGARLEPGLASQRRRREPRRRSGSSTSTSTRCTGPTPKFPSPRPPVHSRSSSMPARSVTSASPTSTPSRWREFAQTRPVETLQPPYHLFRRDIEREILPYCAASRHRRAGLRPARPRAADGRPRRAHRRSRQATGAAKLPSSRARLSPQSRGRA